MNAAKRLSAVILTGGRSPLFGADAVGAEFARERLIERLAWTLAEFPFDRFALVAPPGKAGVEPDGVAILADDEQGVGPIAGIVTALRRLPDGIFVAASNMPFVSAEIVEWLLGHDAPEAAAVIPRHRGGIEPFFAIYNKSALAHVERALADRDSLAGELEKAAVRYVEVPERFSTLYDFTRVHTPQEYERALEVLEKSRTSVAAR